MSEPPTVTTGLGVSIPAARQAPTGKSRAAIRRGKRTFRGFAVLDTAGNLAWGSFRPTEAAALDAYRTWNPTIAGFPTGEIAVSVTVIIENQPKN